MLDKFSRKIVDFIFGEQATVEVRPSSLQVSSVLVGDNNNEIIAYPPKKDGIPLQIPSDILRPHRKLLDRIKLSSGEEDKAFIELYEPIILRFAEYVHLLPASEFHHHAMPGGLLRHGLEVALIALMKADRTLYGTDKPPSQRQSIEKRWKLAVFLAGLSHDIGKPLTDMIVVADTGEQWSPFLNDLYSWGKQRGVQYYTVSWIEGRHKQHEAVSGLVLDFLAGHDVKNYLYDGDPAILHMMMSAIISPNSDTNMIAKIVSESDHQSTKHDNEKTGSSVKKSSSIKRRILDAIAQLLSDGSLEINTEKKQAYLIKEGLFLSWPKCASLIQSKMNDSGSGSGIPKDPRFLADLLIDEGIALEGIGLFQARTRVWRINVPNLIDDDGDWCLRIADFSSLDDPSNPMDVKPIEGCIWKQEGNEKIESIIDAVATDKVESISTGIVSGKVDSLAYDAELDNFRKWKNIGFVLHALLLDVIEGKVQEGATHAVMLHLPKELPVSWDYIRKSGFLEKELMSEMKELKMIVFHDLNKPVHIIEGHKYIVFNEGVKTMFTAAMQKSVRSEQSEQKPLLDIDYFVMTAEAIKANDPSLPAILDNENGKFIEIGDWIVWLQGKTNDSKAVIKQKITKNVPTSYFVVIEENKKYLRIA